MDAAELTDLRTLGQIAAQLGQQLAAAPAAVQSTEAKPAQTQPVTTVTAVHSALSAEQVEQALLSVVSEKTGYPVETLEPDMDMEADLGIDSIKRVEILGAMQTQFPDLPKVDAGGAD